MSCVDGPKARPRFFSFLTSLSLSLRCHTNKTSGLDDCYNSTFIQYVSIWIWVIWVTDWISASLFPFLLKSAWKYHCQPWCTPCEDHKSDRKAWFNLICHENKLWICCACCKPYKECLCRWWSVIYNTVTSQRYFCLDWNKQRCHVTPLKIACSLSESWWRRCFNAIEVKPMCGCQWLRLFFTVLNKMIPIRKKVISNSYFHKTHTGSMSGWTLYLVKHSCK